VLNRSLLTLWQDHLAWMRPTHRCRDGQRSCCPKMRLYSRPEEVDVGPPARSLTLEGSRDGSLAPRRPLPQRRPDARVDINGGASRRVRALPSACRSAGAHRQLTIGRGARSSGSTARSGCPRQFRGQPRDVGSRQSMSAPRLAAVTCPNGLHQAGRADPRRLLPLR
jgi:hypothetical protein